LEPRWRARRAARLGRFRPAGSPSPLRSHQRGTDG
jgi:hypothetical protein